MISRVILQLEDALGQQLFYRNTRAVIPTEAGRLFVEYARAMTEQLSEARKELLDRSLEPAGTVRINAPVFFGQRHIAPWLPALSRRYPRLAIELTQTDDYIDPHREASDVIFRIGALTDSSFHARVFGTQRYHLAASPAYLQRHGEPAAPADLHHHRSLVYRARQARTVGCSGSPTRLDPLADFCVAYLQQCGIVIDRRAWRHGDGAVSRLADRRQHQKGRVGPVDAALPGGNQHRAAADRRHISSCPSSAAQCPGGDRLFCRGLRRAALLAVRLSLRLRGARLTHPAND